MGTDKFKIDRHKLIYHIPRVYDWLKGKNIYPVYIEVGLYSGCNQRCIFCAFDFLRYKASSLSFDYFKKFIRKAAQKSVKSILLAGEGEPLMYKNLLEAVSFAKKKGIDLALTTNGVMLNKDTSKALLANLVWLKISLDAASKNSYAHIHRTQKGDFDTVVKNIEEAVKIRNRYNYDCTIGAQFLLIPDNYKETVKFVNLMSKVGVDYVVIKPYSVHPSSSNKLDLRFLYRNTNFLERQINKYARRNFQVIFRRNTMDNLLSKRKSYGYCLGLPFATHITAKGEVYPCNFFVGKKDFMFGNIYREDFEDIWEGQRRKKIMNRIYKQWDISNCRKGCRLDEINRYLWELKHPNGHINFI